MIQISFDSKEISRAVNTVAKVINKKNALPILGQLLLKMEDKRFYLIASSGEAWVKMRLEESTAVLLQGKLDSICLPTDYFRSAVDSVPEQKLQCEIDDDLTKIQVRHLTGEFSLPISSADEYPLPPVVEQPSVEVVFSSQWLLANCDMARGSVASDELRPVMDNVALDLTHDGCTLVSSNGHTLFKTSMNVGVGGEKAFLTGTPQVILLHSSILHLLSAFGASEEITITATTNMVTLSSDNICVTFRPIEGKYPNYNSVIPVNQPYQVHVDVRTLRSALGRVGLFANDNVNLVRLDFNADQLTATAEDIDFGRNGMEHVSLADSNIPDNFAIGLKLSSYIQMLKNIKTETAIMEMSGPDKPVVIREDDVNSTKVCLVMPMLIE